VAAILWEALRFAPANPVIYRRTPADVMLGNTKISAGTMVIAANLSAMFDEAEISEPGRFIAPRPWEVYTLWGEGLHLCWGDRINRALLPAMLMPLLARENLRAASAPDGRGTPFPRHYRLLFAR